MTPPRVLAISIGNTSLFAGLFVGGRRRKAFRVPIGSLSAPAAFGRLVAGRLPRRIDAVAICSVVPALTDAVARGARARWGSEPRVLRSAGPHGLKVAYRRLGADRLAAALGARALHPGRNLIVVDCGTATTVTALSRTGAVLGGAILPGFGLWPEMLAARTAQLPRVAARRPRSPLGRSTGEGIRSGAFHGHAGAIRELVRRVRQAAFGGGGALVVGTGGHAAGFARERLFDRLEPDLVLRGLLAFAGAPA